MSSGRSASKETRRGIPKWDEGELPAAQPLTRRDWYKLLGPGIVLMGGQIGGGEWLLGPEVTAKYGGGLMWIATIAIILQVFYNLECGRYALYCGEPITTGFMRTKPDPRFWMGFILALNLSALIPGISTHGAAMLVSLWLGRPPGEEDRQLVSIVAYITLGLVVLPVFIGGKVYNTLQTVMTIKVVGVLAFCFLMGVFFVSPANWWNIFSGFAKFGTLPIGSGGDATTVNIFAYWYQNGSLPVIALGDIAVIGAFAGYAGGGGLGNSTYSNFVRDKGWGMGSAVGAIPSAVGGHNVTLSHVGRTFPINAESMARWKVWWNYVFVDQVFVWAPGCFMGMALPALLSLQFAPFSSLKGAKLDWAQSLITADGIRHATSTFLPGIASVLWFVTIIVGLLVMLPSQMSIVDDFSRRWTDMLWSGSELVRKHLSGNQVKGVYYGILSGYVLWSYVCAYLFTTYGTPKLMTLIIANLNNLSIGATAILLLWINCTRLPRELHPHWYQKLGVALCALFFLGLTAIVFVTKQLPAILEYLGKQS